MSKVCGFYSEKQLERDLKDIAESLGDVTSRKKLHDKMVREGFILDSLDKIREGIKLDKERDERMMGVNPFLVQARRQAEKKMLSAKTEDEFWDAAGKESDYDMELMKADWEAFPEEPKKEKKNRSALLRFPNVSK